MEIKKADFTEEMIRQAKTCKSLEGLIALARENGRELTEEEAKGYFEKLNPANGELADDELDSVSGGGLCDSDDTTYIKYDNGVCSECRHKLYQKEMTVNGIRGYYWYCNDCKKSSKELVGSA